MSQDFFAFNLFTKTKIKTFEYIAMINTQNYFESVFYEKKKHGGHRRQQRCQNFIIRIRTAPKRFDSKSLIGQTDPNGPSGSLALISNVYTGNGTNFSCNKIQ